MKVKNKIKSLKILEYFLRSIKKGFATQKSSSSLKYVMHSILGRGSFSTNSSIGEVWCGSNQSVALLRDY